VRIFPVKGRLWIILVLSVVLFLAYSAVGERGFVRFGQMTQQRNDLRLRVRDLRETNAQLSGQIGLLRDDPATIEYIARTELGMVRDGETVYILSERPGDSSR
jgi:cell division protein FtsB